MPKLIIKAKDIVNDIREGVADRELMEKYNLSSKGLQSVFKKLVAAKAVRPTELYDRAPILEADTTDAESIREEMREFLEVKIPICELNAPENAGVINDVSGKGVGVTGLQARQGEAKTLAVMPDSLFPVDPFSFDAVCRWVKTREAEGSVEAGFEITNISEESVNRLTEVIRLLNIGNRLP